jgi:exopolyphosphatase/guanosine-5'-triphosphate,3'-diphosphate pyrophosphatase
VLFCGEKYLLKDGEVLMSYAAIDIGSNSCRLLIADIHSSGLQTLYKEIGSTRISTGLSQSGQISAEAAERSLHWLAKTRAALQTYGVEQYRAVATSAVREASNGQAFVDEAARRSQLVIEIISGEEEARLSYIGVEKGLHLDHPPLVVDLGGGSTEFICNEQDFVTSLPLGAVRATEMKLSAAAIVERLQVVQPMKSRFREYPLVMVGGTASSLAAIQLGLDIYDSEQVHGHRLSRQEISDIYQLLERTPLRLRQRMPGLQAERADIINQGVLIILLIADMLEKTEIIVSESDLLQGVLWCGKFMKNFS